MRYVAKQRQWSSAWRRSQECAPLARGLVQRCRALLGAPGSARDAAARLLGSLLARPDMAAALDGFAAWAADALRAAGPEAVFLVPGGRPAELGMQWSEGVAPIEPPVFGERHGCCIKQP